MAIFFIYVSMNNEHEHENETQPTEPTDDKQLVFPWWDDVKQ